MTDEEIGARLFAEIAQFVQARFGPIDGEGAAAVMLDDHSVLVSTAPATLNESVALCHETGALCEAYKRNRRVVATMCLSCDARGQLIVLSPCGVCQERLWVYGGDVRCAVPQLADSTRWQWRPLRELNPYYWRLAIEAPPQV